MSNNVENQPDGTGGDAYGFLRTLRKRLSRTLRLFRSGSKPLLQACSQVVHLCSKETKPPAQLNNSIRSRALEIANVVMKSDIYKKIEGVSRPKMTDYR